jgi:hypothetical protein
MGNLKNLGQDQRIEDVAYWEIVAYSWIVDAIDEEAREVAWRRFGSAFPEHVHETCSEFHKRIKTTRWYHKHHKQYEPDPDGYC